MKQYIPKWYKLVGHIVVGFIAGGFVSLIRVKNIVTQEIAIGVGVIIVLVFSWFAWSEYKLKITINDNVLSVYQGHRHCAFHILKHRFGSKTDSDGIQKIYVYDDSLIDTIDCDFLSASDFMDLQKELGIVGDKQKPVQLVTKKKEDK